MVQIPFARMTTNAITKLYSCCTVLCFIGWVNRSLIMAIYCVAIKYSARAPVHHKTVYILHIWLRRQVQCAIGGWCAFHIILDQYAKGQINERTNEWRLYAILAILLLLLIVINNNKKVVCVCAHTKFVWPLAIDCFWLYYFLGCRAWFGLRFSARL